LMNINLPTVPCYGTHTKTNSFGKRLRRSISY
jgi:hypothetical protein